jgi:hypothetical protein
MGGVEGGLRRGAGRKRACDPASACARLGALLRRDRASATPARVTSSARYCDRRRLGALSSSTFARCASVVSPGTANRRGGELPMDEMGRRR